MYRCIHIILNEPLADYDGILKVIPVPRHEGNKHVLAESQLSLVGCRTVSYDISSFYLIAYIDDRFLIEACCLVRTAELYEIVDINTTVITPDNYPAGVDRLDYAVPLGKNYDSRIAGSNRLHTCANTGRVRLKQRDRLPLHI